jgi:two-component system response regulator AtoC
MNPALQAKLLRVLQEKQFERLGGTETIAMDTRLVAATNQNLEQLIAQGKFRQDLFYRLNVYPIPLPSLRERKEDIPALALHFLAKYNTELEKEVVGLSQEANALLLNHRWSGNVRELENVMQRAVILCQGPIVTAQDLPLSLLKEAQAPQLVSEGSFQLPPGGIALAELEKQLILQALKQVNNNKVQAGRLLSLSRTQLRTRMRNHGLESE